MYNICTPIFPPFFFLPVCLAIKNHGFIPVPAILFQQYKSYSNFHPSHILILSSNSEKLGSHCPRYIYLNLLNSPCM